LNTSFIIHLFIFLFLYIKFHFDIRPIGAHDDRAGAASFDYMYDALFECNSGSPLINFGRLFSTHKELMKLLKMNKQTNKILYIIFSF
jgi:hypothetical protein